MDKLTSRHLMFIIWGTSIVSMKTNINIFLRDAGRDAWLAIAISSLLILFYMLYMISACVKETDFNLVKVYHTAVGKPAGTILLGFFMFNLFLILIESAAVEASAMHVNIFLETPPWYLILFFVIPAIYTVRQGITAIVSVTIIGVLLAMFAGINLVILTERYKEYKYLLPIMADGVTPGFIMTLLKTLGFYGSIAILFPYIGYIKETNKLKRHVIIAVLIVLQMHVFSAVGAIVSFGIERAQLLAYPKLIQTQQINYLGFLESGELFVMFQIIGGWFMKYVLAFHGILKILEDLKFKNNLVTFGISAVVLLSSYYVSVNLWRLEMYLNIIAYISLVNFIFLPLLIFMLFQRKKKKESSQIEENSTPTS